MLENLFSELQTETHVYYDLMEKAFDIPVLPKAQCIVIPLIRESIAPMIIRNNDADMITDTELAGDLRVRMIASKTKGVEKRRGNQILRLLNVGGKVAANKAYVKDKPSDVFDLNTFVFGDAATGGKSKKSIYPIHAAVLYSDAISFQPYDTLIDDVFRQGGISEDFVSYDAEEGKTSNNIFTTRSVRPNALFVQTLVMTGQRMTKEALNHLLLSIGLAGAYGGSTATTGTNLKTHFCGIYWGKLERPINAPSELLTQLQTERDAPKTELEMKAQQYGAKQLVNDVAELMQANYQRGINAADLAQYVNSLVDQFEQDDAQLKQSYAAASKQMGELFDAWFKG